MKRNKKFSFIELNKKKPKVISWLTSYDYPIAYAAEMAGIDMILVGDSGGMVQHGFSSTIPVTMQMSLDMCNSVRRGAPSTFLVGDMPFGSYEISDSEAVKNAVLMIKDGKTDSIKLEGGKRISSRVKAISEAGIIVFGHIGLTPQSVNSFGGYRVQGKSLKSFDNLVEDAICLEKNGASAILLEAVPEICSKAIRSNVSIPIFGIGAGGGIDGQLLIAHDLLGLYPDFTPRFAKNYFDDVIKNIILKKSKNTKQFLALDLYIEVFKKFDKDVKNNKFPSKEYTYPISSSDLKLIKSSKYWTE